MSSSCAEGYLLCTFSAASSAALPAISRSRLLLFELSLVLESNPASESETKHQGCWKGRKSEGKGKLSTSAFFFFFSHVVKFYRFCPKTPRHDSVRIRLEPRVKQTRVTPASPTYMLFRGRCDTRPHPLAHPNPTVLHQYPSSSPNSKKSRTGQALPAQR